MTSTTITIIGSLGGLLLAFYGLIRWQIGQIDARLGRFEGEVNNKFAEAKEDTKAGFARVDARFAEMKRDTNDRFEKVDARFDKVDARFDKAEERAKEQLAEAKKDTNDRFNKVEAEVGHICVRLTGIDKRLTEADTSRREMNKKLDAIPSLEAGIQELLRNHTSMNSQLADLEIKFSRLEPLSPQGS